ncbi:MAG: hypothetical protein OEU91_02775 [Gammaproteobacteria bacterium]|nr:hypothetical protein [Gammaproteobacteria bacterium]
MSFKKNCRLRFAQSVLAAAAIAPLTPVAAQTIISEVFYDAVGQDNGQVFVELYGTPGTLLDGLFLDGINGTDGSAYLTVALTGTIGNDGVFVIGDDSGDGSTLVSGFDLVANVDFQNGPDSVVLRDSGGILDALGYGDFTSAVFAGEGSAAPDVDNGWSLARASLLDTDNNVVDFLGLSVPTPGIVPASAVPVPPALVLFLSGIAGLVGVARRKC